MLPPWHFRALSVAANGGCDLLGTGEALPRLQDTIKMLFRAVRWQGDEGVRQRDECPARCALESRDWRRRKKKIAFSVSFNLRSPPYPHR
jgi:hypothetical protein